MANIKELSDKGPDGTRLGQTAADLISFHGATPADQRAFTADVSTSVPVSSCGVFGFSTSAQPIALIALVNEMKALLVEKGLMASS